MWSKWWIYINIISKPHVLLLEHLNSLCETQLELDTSLSYHLNKYSYFMPLHFSNLFNVKRHLFTTSPTTSHISKVLNPREQQQTLTYISYNIILEFPNQKHQISNNPAPKTSNGNKHVSLLTYFGKISFLFHWRRYVSCPGPFMSDSFPIHFTYHFFNLQHLLVGVFNPSLKNMCKSNWIISPNKGWTLKHIYPKPPPIGPSLLEAFQSLELKTHGFSSKKLQLSRKLWCFGHT